MLPGCHRVRKSDAEGRRVEYWYAWRGGPQILKAVGRSDAERDRVVQAMAAGAAEAYRALIGPRTDGQFLSGLISQYLGSANYRRLSPRTQRDYRLALDVARRDLGEMEVRALEAPRARQVLIAWRDTFQSNPKTADARLGALALVLQWAKGRGDLQSTPLLNWPRLYRTNRAEHIWTEDDLAQLWPHCDPAFARAVRFAAQTGLRLGDLVQVSKAAIGDTALVWRTAKSKGRSTVVIPITPALREVLEDMPRHGQKGYDAVTILTSSLGRPWTASGLQTAMQRAKQAAQRLHRTTSGDPKAAGPIHHLRFHDLRGTAATRLIKSSLTLDDTALIMGWKRGRVEAIAIRYVTSEAIGLGMLERMNENVS